MRKALPAAVAAFLLLMLAGCSAASEPTSAPPLIKTDGEIAQKRFQCLKSKGWDVRLEKGAIYSEVPPAQKPRFDSDDTECLKEAGFDPDAPISDEQFKEIYASYKRIENCLKRGGWGAPPRPTFESFTSTYESDPWIPWSDVPADELPSAGKQCPEMLGNEG